MIAPRPAPDIDRLKELRALYGPRGASQAEADAQYEADEREAIQLENQK